MLRLMAVLGMVALLTACYSTPRVYAMADDRVDQPTGRIDPLGTVLGTARHKVRVVFIHGVGDTCPGFVLDEDRGWLNKTTATRIGLQPTQPVQQCDIELSAFLAPPADPLAKMTYTVRPFDFKPPGASVAMSLEVVEITWSLLAQWIKTKHLSYDSPSVFSVVDENTPCLVAPEAAHSSISFAPPSRMLANQFVKESIFDRNLADSMIYAGTYGQVIELGVAEALCHVASDYIGSHQDERVPCMWPAAGGPHSDSTYVFVTHSLGGRIL